MLTLRGAGLHETDTPYPRVQHETLLVCFYMRSIPSLLSLFFLFLQNPAPSITAVSSSQLSMMTKRLGTIRSTYLAALCCIGSFLFAYDTGIVGGVLTLASFERDFRYTKAGAVNVAANSTSLLQAGGRSTKT